MVEYVHLQFQQTLRGRPLPNSQTELEPAVKAILTAVHCAALQVGEELKSFTSDTISKYDLGIKLKAAIAEVDKIKQQIDSKKASEYNNGSKIKSLDRYLVNESGDESIRKGIGDIKTDVLDKLDKLQNVKDETNSIESRKTKADELMNSLKNEIQNKLIEFELNLTSADDALTKTIDSVYSAAVKAEEDIKLTVQQLNKTLLETTEYAFKRVTDEVQKLFAEGHKSHLTALISLVDTKIPKVKTIIDDDLNTGLKGLLKTLKENHERLQDMATKHKFENRASIFRAYLEPIFNFTLFDLPKHLPNSQYSPQLQSIHSALTTLLSHLSEQKHFTHQVPGMLAELKTSVQALHSTNFANPAYPVLDAFPKSLVRFVEQLQRGYVNRYEGSKPITWQEHFSNNPTEESKMTAKIFLSVFSILNTNLSELRKRCKVDWRGDQINEFTELGTFFSDNGFVVSDNNKQNGELQNKEGMNGTKVVGCLVGDYPRVFPSVENTRHAINTIVDSLLPTTKSVTSPHSPLISYHVQSTKCSHGAPVYAITVRTMRLSST
ncbi:hypothetical protein, conserved [Babesia ovata]|uniref:Extracellular matrix-binding ebh n=1 Tax=Babesia ovata TaxID=189622 RepID=A0A2H6KJP9_9APIC|nr:uncharacterized protein BOVATA_046920 [Babesia ovata]GBE63199.1 hypothetical protein, conserved [Babesia ovata]